MTGPRSGAPPGKRIGPADSPSRLEATGGGKSLANTVTLQADDSVPSSHPWARRADARDVELRYRRSVYYWRRRPACDRHGQRAEHECTT
jgi:hypothetical protein